MSHFERDPKILLVLSRDSKTIMEKSFKRWRSIEKWQTYACNLSIRAIYIDSIELLLFCYSDTRDGKDEGEEVMKAWRRVKKPGKSIEILWRPKTPFLSNWRRPLRIYGASVHYTFLASIFAWTTGEWGQGCHVINFSCLYLLMNIRALKCLSTLNLRNCSGKKRVFFSFLLSIASHYAFLPVCPCRFLLHLLAITSSLWGALFKALLKTSSCMHSACNSVILGHLFS